MENDLEKTCFSKRKLRTLLLSFTLILGALGGMPMRPEEIEELMSTMNQTKTVHVVTEESEGEKLPNSYLIKASLPSFCRRSWSSFAYCCCKRAFVG